MRELAGRISAIVFRFHRVLAIALQILIIVASNQIAFWLRFDGNVPDWAVVVSLQMLPWLLVIRAATFVPFRLHAGLWRYTSIYDLQALIGGVSISTVLFYAFAKSPLGPTRYPRSIFIIDALLLLLMLGGVRLTRRLYAEFTRGNGGKRVLIFGAGDAADLIVRDMKNDRQHSFYPIGFVDDDEAKLGRRIHGVPVLGTRRDVPHILKEYRPDEVLIAIPRAEPNSVRSIVRVFEPFKIPIKTLPSLQDLIDGHVEVAQIRTLSVEDLLARVPVGLDRRSIEQLIAGRRVMVTGAGGSIGSELCRQLARHHPSALFMLDRYENGLHEIRMELQDRQKSLGAYAIIADVTDEVRVRHVLEEHRPEIIFHAAAHKHVPLMEENPCEAVKNNVRGTRLLARAAEQSGVDRFIMISTDKAVNPTSVMGASKRVAELVVQAQAEGSGTAFSIVRFGNVLGSNGSVVPRFVGQIRKGGPVTVTHPEMRRFFMLISEAVQLVLHAASHAESGATYVLEMGEQVKLVDMARDMIRLSGLVPDEDIKIEFVGLRPGEKLYEELVGADEEAEPSRVEKILCVRNRRRPSPDLLASFDALEEAATRGDEREVLSLMEQLVHLGVAAPVAGVAAAVRLDTATPTFVSDQQACPNCTPGRLVRLRSRSLSDRVRKHFTTERLFQCDTCEWRGWLIPMSSGEHAQVDPPTPPDLSAIDYGIAQQSVSHRSNVSPRDLP